MLDYGAELAPASLETLLAWLTGDIELPASLAGSPALAGQAEGPLVGGSLTLVAASIGTAWEIDTHGAILLLEEVHENPYRVDRMLQQLRGAGKLDSIVGLGIGDVSTCVDPKYGSRVDDVVLEVARALGVPCVAGLRFGHTPSNLTWPFGGRATIDGERGEIRMLEPGVEVA
jgi:muramoyltetrapeptide carboxypeptidase